MIRATGAVLIASVLPYSLHESDPILNHRRLHCSTNTLKKFFAIVRIELTEGIRSSGGCNN